MVQLLHTFTATMRLSLPVCLFAFAALAFSPLSLATSVIGGPIDDGGTVLPRLLSVERYLFTLGAGSAAISRLQVPSLSSVA